MKKIRRTRQNIKRISKEIMEKEKEERVKKK